PKYGYLEIEILVVQIIGKFTQGGKVDEIEKHLTHRLVIDEGELDFLIKDCTDAGTFAGREKCPLGFILTYYEGHQPQYTIWTSYTSYQTPMLFHINQKNKKSEKSNLVNGVIRNRHWESIKNIPESTAPSIHDPITRCQKSYLNGEGGSGKTTRAIRIFKNINMVVFTHTNALAKDFREKRDVKAQTWHSFFRWNGVGEWTSECMGEKKFPRVVIWDEVICCGDDAQPPPFFGEMPHNCLKECTNYYEKVLTDYRAKCPKLRELKKGMCRKNNRIQSKLFREILLTIEKWECLKKEWTPSDHILSAHHLSRRIASQKCLELHYQEMDINKNCLVSIPGSSEKQELVKNNIVHLPLNTLPEKFIKDILTEEKILDWDLGYAMTVHTSQGMTLEAPQRVWVIDEHLAWDNLIYLAVGHVEYLS
ncbi:3172_t:CDS:2, partial [Paraglomus occultum]